MNPMMIRSITLSEETSQAWKDAGGWYPRRERSLDECLSLYRSRFLTIPDDPIINLGNTAFAPTEEQLQRWTIDPNLLFNHGDNIRPLVRPGATRALFDSLLPPHPYTPQGKDYSRFWVKAPGSRGKGKEARERTDEVVEVPKDWDLQVHIEGKEFRVITVRDKVVQVLSRYGTPTDRTYEWIGVTNSPSSVKQAAKDASRLLSGNNIIGWDIMLNHDDRAFVLEGNSCPGVSLPTVERILKSIQGKAYEDA